MFQKKFVEKIKTRVLYSVTPTTTPTSPSTPGKSCRLFDKVEKYCRARQATDEDITRRTRFACWITQATATYSEYVVGIAFPQQQWLRESNSMLCFK